MHQFIQWGGLTPEQFRAKQQMEIMEARLSQAMMAPVGANSGPGPAPNWISVTNTAYLYPIQYIEEALNLTQANVTRTGSQFTFATIADIDAFWYDMWYRTFLALPNQGNPQTGGFACAVGTQFTGSYNEIYFSLQTGQPIAILQEVTQVTDQETLPNSGNSPQGTVGYVPVWVDGDGNWVPDTILENAVGNIDPLRVVEI
jgi:hypothetical protein